MYTNHELRQALMELGASDRLVGHYFFRRIGDLSVFCWACEDGQELRPTAYVDSAKWLYLFGFRIDPVPVEVTGNVVIGIEAPYLLVADRAGQILDGETSQNVEVELSNLDDFLEQTRFRIVAEPGGAGAVLIQLNGTLRCGGRQFEIKKHFQLVVED